MNFAVGSLLTLALFIGTRAAKHCGTLVTNEFPEIARIFNSVLKTAPDQIASDQKIQLKPSASIIVQEPTLHLECGDDAPNTLEKVYAAKEDRLSTKVIPLPQVAYAFTTTADKQECSVSFVITDLSAGQSSSDCEFYMDEDSALFNPATCANKVPDIDELRWHLEDFYKNKLEAEMAATFTKLTFPKCGPAVTNERASMAKIFSDVFKEPPKPLAAGSKIRLTSKAPTVLQEPSIMFECKPSAPGSLLRAWTATRDENRNKKPLPQVSFGFTTLENHECSATFAVRMSVGQQSKDTNVIFEHRDVKFSDDKCKKNVPDVRAHLIPTYLEQLKAKTAAILKKLA